MQLVAWGEFGTTIPRNGTPIWKAFLMEIVLTFVKAHTSLSTHDRELERTGMPAIVRAHSNEALTPSVSAPSRLQLGGLCARRFELQRSVAQVRFPVYFISLAQCAQPHAFISVGGCERKLALALDLLGSHSHAYTRPPHPS